MSISEKTTVTEIVTKEPVQFIEVLLDNDKELVKCPFCDFEFSTWDCKRTDAQCPRCKGQLLISCLDGYGRRKTIRRPRGYTHPRKNATRKTRTRPPPILKTPYSEYLQSEHWQALRAAALKAAGNRCQLCYSDLRLEVHHRTYERRGCELLSDLTVLCHRCHAQFHGIYEEK